MVPFTELEKTGEGVGTPEFCKSQTARVEVELPRIPPCTSTYSAFVLLGCWGFPRACVLKSMFFLASRAPQRAATPPQKMRTSKVGAGPWWGRDTSCVPGASAPVEHLSCLPPKRRWVAPNTPEEGVA